MFKFVFLFAVSFFSSNFCFATDSGISTQRYCLSIDGGGLRGVFPAAVLQEIERKTGKSVHQMFPAGFTGTSTGSLIVLGLAARKNLTPKDPNHPDDSEDDYNKPLFTAEKLVTLYKELAEEIFPSCSVANCCRNVKQMPVGLLCKSGRIVLESYDMLWLLCLFRNCCGCCGPKYSNDFLREKLAYYFENRTLKDVLVPVQIVSFSINRNGGPIYFTNIDNPGVLMVDAALASSAAPTYFPPVSFKDPTRDIVRHCIDGGIYENTPVFAALGYAIEQYREKTGENRSLQDFYVLSIGTGSTQLVENPSIFKRFGLLGWASHVVDLSIFGTSSVADRNICRILGKKKYRRIQASIDSFFKEMDDPSVVDPLIAEVAPGTKTMGLIDENARGLCCYGRKRAIRNYW